MRRVKFTDEIVKFIPQRLRSLFNKLSDSDLSRLQEIRLRINCPLNLIFHDGDYFLGSDGLHLEPCKGELIKSSDIGQAILFLSNHSLYALDTELREGFITIPGGHRVGFVGQGVLEEGVMKQIKNFSGVNFRITRHIKGCSNFILPWIIKESDDIHHTMIISPPRCGKTTLLRDIICNLSDGFQGFPGLKVGVVDERSELAGSFQGIPRHHLGVRTDILDHCPKSEGMYLLIRSMSPQIIATDEIGSVKDIAAIFEAINAGIRLIITVHGRNLSELIKRPTLRELIESRIFSRFIVLSNTSGVGTIDGIYDENLSKLTEKSDFKPLKERRCYG